MQGSRLVQMGLTVVSTIVFIVGPAFATEAEDAVGDTEIATPLEVGSGVTPPVDAAPPEITPPEVTPPEAKGEEAAEEGEPDTK